MGWMIGILVLNATFNIISVLYTCHKSDEHPIIYTFFVFFFSLLNVHDNKLNFKTCDLSQVTDKTNDRTRTIVIDGIYHIMLYQVDLATYMIRTHYIKVCGDRHRSHGYMLIQLLNDHGSRDVAFW